MFWATDGVGDGPVEGYGQDQTTEWQRMLWTQDPTTQGVALNYLGELLVTNPEWQTLRVPAGGAVVYGFPYRNTGNLDFVLSIPTLGTTGWRLVLRTDWALRTVRAVLLQNDDGASGYPSVTQNAGYRWEISLAHGSITIGGAVTIAADDRDYLGSVSQIDHNDMADRTRRFLVPAPVGWNSTDGIELQRGSSSGLQFLDNKVCVAYSGFAVPANYLSDLVVKGVVDPDATGNMLTENSAMYSHCGEAPLTHTNTTGWGLIGVVTNIRNCIASISLASADIGDLVDLTFSRDGTGDTIGNVVWFMGWLVEYTADS